MSELTDNEKSAVIKIMGNAFGSEMSKMMDSFKIMAEERKRLDEQRNTEIITRLTRIELMLEIKQKSGMYEAHHTDSQIVNPGETD